jgi:hypothetical protein
VHTCVEKTSLNAVSFNTSRLYRCRLSQATYEDNQQVQGVVSHACIIVETISQPLSRVHVPIVFPNPSKVRNHQTSPFTTTFFTTSDLLYRNIQGAAYRASEMARSFVYVASAESACHARQAPDAESLCAPGHAMSVLAKCDNCLIDCSITVTYHHTRFVWRRR